MATLECLRNVGRAWTRFAVLPTRLESLALSVGIVTMFAPAVAAQDSFDIAPPPLGQLIDIGGRKLHLHCTGRGSPTIVVENGSSSFSIDWALVQSPVSKVTRICTYDRAGFAWSDRGPEINTVEQTMDDLHMLLREASVAPPYVLVGHSIGGMYVRAYQRRYPLEVVGLVLVDATPEEDLGYLVNGVDKRGVAMTYAEMEAVYAPLIKNPPPPRALPTEIDKPLDRLTPDLQQARLWATRRYFAQADMSHAWITAESWRQEFVALRRLRLQHPYVLGDLPLVVLARGRRTDDVLNKREAELAEMSRVGIEHIAQDSDHDIHLYQPQLVSDEIVKLVTKYRSGK